MPRNRAFSHCGERGIRTPGPPMTDNGFRDRRIQPLCHLSNVGLKSAANVKIIMVSAALLRRSLAGLCVAIFRTQVEILREFCCFLPIEFSNHFKIFIEATTWHQVRAKTYFFFSIIQEAKNDRNLCL